MATITGDDTSNSLVGTDSNDTITAKGGNDTLNGKRDNDSLYGDVGDDTYEFSGILFGDDSVIESAGGGSDTIHILSDIPASAVRLVGGYFHGASSNTNDLSIRVDGYGSIYLDNHLTQANVEWLKIGDNEPISLTGGLVMTGSTNNETIYGTAFNDSINGMGGNDNLRGDLGDDTYIVNNTGVTIFEDLPNGNDTVNSTVTYTLSANLEILNLVGTEAINGTGNDLDNNLTGNSADNQLDGGVGKDTMIGGLGNDTYVIDNIDDVVTENPIEGTDTVKSSITYALLPDFENLTLTGTTAINGTGNSSNNILIGNSAANELNGGEGNDNLSGGAGNDTLQAGFGHDDLTGGDGKDAFVFYSPGDFVVHDFKKSDDLLKFDSSTTGLHDLESLLGVITHIDDTPEGVAVHFVYDIASITLIGIHSSDLTASMVEFS